MNRESGQSNRVSVEPYWHYFCEGLSYQQRWFWIILIAEKWQTNLTDKTLDKAIVNFSIGCYNIFRITAQLWQPLERKLYDLKFVFPCNFQNKNDFPALSTTMISQLKWKTISPVWIFPEQFITRTVLFLKIRSSKSPLPCLFALKDWDNCNALGASSAKLSELFHSGKLVLKMILKDDRRSWFGFQVATSLGK